MVNEKFSSVEKKKLRLVYRWVRSGERLCDDVTLENCVALDVSGWSGRLSSLRMSLVLKSSQIESLEGLLGDGWMYRLRS